MEHPSDHSNFFFKLLSREDQICKTVMFDRWSYTSLVSQQKTYKSVGFSSEFVL